MPAKGQPCKAGLSKDSSLGPAMLTVSLHSSDYILYSILKVVINIISEGFGLIGSYVRESYVKMGSLRNMCCPLVKFFKEFLR